jgi:hypothetical protein
VSGDDTVNPLLHSRNPLRTRLSSEVTLLMQEALSSWHSESWALFHLFVNCVLIWRDGRVSTGVLFWGVISSGPKVTLKGFLLCFCLQKKETCHSAHLLEKGKMLCFCILENYLFYPYFHYSFGSFHLWISWFFYIFTQKAVQRELVVLSHMDFGYFEGMGGACCIILEAWTQTLWKQG